MRSKTERLNDRAWDAVGPAFAFTAAAFFSLLPFALMYDPEFPPPLWLQIPVWAMIAGCWCLAALHIWKWALAIYEVRAWRKELDRRRSKRIDRAQMPLRRAFGPSDIWRDNSTGTWDFYLFWVRVWRRDFTHSTGVFE